jgi:crotonobetainyl-CoA:carnitine CoA-transferase CaiB-like acyl-CoA transferase
MAIVGRSSEPAHEPDPERRALAGMRVLDLTDLAGALGTRLLADLGADVVRVEPPRDARPAAPGPSIGAAGTAGDLGSSAAEWFYGAGKRSVLLDPAAGSARATLAVLLAHADVLVEASPPDLLDRFGFARADLAVEFPRLVHVSVSPFGRGGPRATWRGSDLVCAAAAGMVFVNGHPGAPPIAPFGLQAYNSAGVFAAIGALLGLRARRRDGRGGTVDLSVQAATAAAVEHVTGFYRQTGAIESRRGTLHWSRSFRIARCRDGEVLLCLLGDWTTLVEWVASTGGEAALLREPRFEDVDARKADCERLFDALDRWAATQSAAELAETAQLLRLPFARVRAASELGGDPQLAARRFPVAVAGESAGRSTVLPGAPFCLSASPGAPARRPPRPGGHTSEVLSEPQWVGAIAAVPAGEERTVGGERPPRALDGVTVLDFTWVVAGPVATRILADQGARVLKIERKNAADFGSRRGGLSGNLNRGKESVVLDLSKPRGIEIARRLAARSDVVIDNFSARVMRNLGLDYESLRARQPGLIAVSMSGFGHSGPWRDHVSYGPTLQALAGFPYLMRLPGGPPAGWGYSWSDMAGGMMAALATLAALEHRDRSGAGQWVDLGQYETLISLLGPAVSRALSGEEIESPGNASQEGPAMPHGVFRCAAGTRADGSPDDDRWVAIAVLDDGVWSRLADLLLADGEPWAAAADLARHAGRVARRVEVERALEAWTRRRPAEEVQALLQAAGVAAALVANGEDLCERDPQLRSRGFFRPVRSAEGQMLTFDALPFAGDLVAGDVLAPGPLLGEHTDVVLRELAGIDDDELIALRAEGVIA